MLCGAAHTHAVDVSFLHVCTNEWLPTASTLCPLSLPSKKAQAVSLSYTQSIVLLTLEGGGAQRERAWYTLFVHALIISVITGVGVILENIRRYPSWECTKILKYPKMYWKTCGYAERVAAHTTASDCLLGQSLVKLVAI